MYQKSFPITLLDHITLYRINYLYSPFRNRSLCNNCNIQHLTVYSSHLSHLFRRFLGSRVDVSNHDEPALSICSTLWAYVVFFHILFYSVHPSQFRSAPGSGSWNLSRQDILCYIVFFSPLNMTEPGQSFLREESVYWLYVGIFTDGSISNMIFSCLSLHPSQHLHFCCIYLTVYSIIIICIYL